MAVKTAALGMFKGFAKACARVGVRQYLGSQAGLAAEVGVEFVVDWAEKGVDWVIAKLWPKEVAEELGDDELRDAVEEVMNLTPAEAAERIQQAVEEGLPDATAEERAAVAVAMTQIPDLLRQSMAVTDRSGRSMVRPGLSLADPEQWRSLVPKVGLSAGTPQPDVPLARPIAEPARLAAPQVAPLSQQGVVSSPLVLDLGRGTTMELALIQPGKFMMGSPEDEPDRSSDESQHLVHITRPYYLGQTPVTQAQWSAVMGRNPSHFKGDDLPVENVSWEDCQEFCKKLAAKVGRSIRLPTEAEWEYACRAGTTTPFHFGETISTKQANYNGNYTYADGRKGEIRQKTTPVKTFAPNEWALYDMHGNVWEWCQDWFGEYPKGSVENPTGQTGGQRRVLRGGSWYSDPGICRSACRGRRGPASRGDRTGFRVAAGT